MSKGKQYNKIQAKDNMVVETDENGEEVRTKDELKQIVSTVPKKRKRSLLGRLTRGVLGPDGASNIGQYVTEEIVVPAIKNIIVDAVTSGINMVIYGESRPRSHRNQTTHYGHRTTHRPTTNYTSRYTSSQPEPSERIIARPGRQGVEEYTIEDRYDAAHVLTALTEYADRYDAVSVAEYYDLIGVPSHYTDHNYGWTVDTITEATIVPIRGGYIIKFPPVEVI